VELWAEGRGGRYRPREAEGTEYERLWGLANALYDGYGKYQELAGARRIPLIVCEPVESYDAVTSRANASNASR
jgi:hypothetical protein